MRASSSPRTRRTCPLQGRGAAEASPARRTLRRPPTWPSAAASTRRPSPAFTLRFSVARRSERLGEKLKRMFTIGCIHRRRRPAHDRGARLPHTHRPAGAVALLVLRVLRARLGGGARAGPFLPFAHRRPVACRLGDGVLRGVPLHAGGASRAGLKRAAGGGFQLSMRYTHVAAGSLGAGGSAPLPNRPNPSMCGVAAADVAPLDNRVSSVPARCL